MVDCQFYWKKKQVTVAVAILFGVGLTGCGNRQSPQDLFKEAQKDHASGKDSAAVIQLKNALQKDPGYGDARYLLGQIYEKTGNLAAAEDELRQAKQSGVKDNQLMGDLVKVYLERAEFQRVIDEILPDPTSPPQVQADYLTHRGDAFLGLGDLQGAEASFEAAVRIAPGDPNPVLGQARLRFSQGKSDDAMKLVDQVIQKDPGNITALLMKGDFFRAGNNPDAASMVYKKVLESDPANRQALSNLALLYISSGKEEDAKSQISAYEKFYPKSIMGNYLKALLDYRLDNFIAARDEVAQVLQAAPGYAPALLLRGMVAYQLNSLETALHDLGRFVEANPANGYAKVILALTQLKQNHPEDALKSLQPLLASPHPDPKTLSIAVRCYMLLGKYDLAIQILRKQSSEAPKDSLVRTQLGLSYLAMGQTAQAINDLELAAKMDSNSLIAEDTLVLAYLGNKNYDLTLRTLQELIKKNPKNAEYHNLEGAAFVGKHEMVNARKSFETALSLAPTYSAAMLNLAQLDLSEKKNGQARTQLEDLLKHDAKNLQAMMSLASLSLNEGKDAEFVEWLLKATKANPTALQPRIELVRYYLQKKENQKALDQAAQGVTNDPNNPAALDLLGETQLALERGQEAVGTYTRLAEVAPSSALVQYRLGSAQVMAKNDTAAIAAFENALKLQPGYVDAIRAWVNLDIAAGHFDAATRVAEGYRTRYPGSPVGDLLLGDIEMPRKSFGKAAMFYENAQHIAPSTNGAIKLYAALFQGEGKDRANREMIQWVSSHSNDRVARQYLASALLIQGNYGGAAEQYQALLRIDPNDPQALNNLAWIYQQNKDPRARATAQQAYKLSPENTEVMDTLGWILVTQGDVKAGLELLKKAVSAPNSPPVIFYHYGAALAQSGNRVEAQQVLKTLVDSGKHFPQRKEAQDLLEKLKS
ncbi:MAG: PEP-CTERM system TPR-repeat protein PrsT [Ferrovum sp.]|nr:PEP-CTERM system TPR-repeat protein PrsT [Ferrovum sp.]